VKVHCKLGEHECKILEYPGGEMTRLLWSVAIAGLLLPAFALADDISCSLSIDPLTGNNVVTIMEVNEKPGSGTCQSKDYDPGDLLDRAKSDVHVGVLEPGVPVDPKKPYSDKLNINAANGAITVLSDFAHHGDEQNLPQFSKPADVTVTEGAEGTFGPVTWTVLGQHGGTTEYVFFSDLPGVSPPPAPEPGTLALFGTGLLSLAGIVRRQLKKKK